ncbi:MAG: biopolymer transporter ExbD [Planctomycetota bacterium]|nr:biopolymer transporter ExbD [Planctomycetota bacterium]
MNALDSIREERAELDMTPMIDVTFLLLIFFMCTLRFKVLEGQLTAFLPKDVGNIQAPAVPLEKLQVSVRVTDPGQKMNAAGTLPYTEGSDHGRHTFQDRQLRYDVGSQSFHSLQEFQSAVRRIATGRDQPCVLQAYPGVILEDVIPVLDGLTGSGFVDIAFGGSMEVLRAPVNR